MHIRRVDSLRGVNESVSVGLSASAVEVEGGDIVSGNVGEVGLHGGVAGRGVRAEPGGVTGGRGGVG